MTLAQRLESLTVVPPRRSPARASARLWPILVVFLGVIAFSLPMGAAAPVAPVLAAPHAGVAPAGHAAVVPSAGTFNPPCYPVNTTVCVSILNDNESDIIPNPGSFYANVEPNTSVDIPLVVKAREQLDWVGAQHAGPKSPITLNVTAVTWNGDPYYTPYDGDVWHSASATSYWTGPWQVPTNKSGYTWWYNVSIAAHASNGAPNFLPGMSITWWIALIHNDSNVLTPSEGPHLHFTYSQAWPYSPYPGSGQYVAGGGATFEDINLTVTPLSPNWNDSVHLVLNTTQADVLANATIGSAYVDVTEVGPTGLLIQTGTIDFPVPVTANGFGAVSTTAVIPASYAQVAGSIVTYRVTASDVPGDTVVAPSSTYTVGGNGSFLSGVFLDDLDVASGPATVIDQSPSSCVPPGTPVNLTLTSRNAGTAISAAEVQYSVTLALVHETVNLTVPFHRTSSTIFQAKIPGLPLGATVTFSLFAWDFTQRLEVSPQFGYCTPDFTTFVPAGVPVNSTFFYVLVYDNGSHSWVSNAKVQVMGPGGFFNSLGNSTFGLSYPNSTQGLFQPLLLPAGATYQVSVNDPWFQPSGHTAGAVVVNVSGQHALTNEQTLYQGSDYLVVQEQNIFLFYLNSTPPAPTNSPSSTTTYGSYGFGGFTAFDYAGMIAFAVASFSLFYWWKQIGDRRKAEERRVTL